MVLQLRTIIAKQVHNIVTYTHSKKGVNNDVSRKRM